MKVAVVYNRQSTSVINLFGQPNRERYWLKSINRILDALKSGGHQAPPPLPLPRLRGRAGVRVFPNS